MNCSLLSSSEAIQCEKTDGVCESVCQCLCVSLVHVCVCVFSFFLALLFHSGLVSSVEGEWKGRHIHSTNPNPGVCDMQGNEIASGSIVENTLLYV